MIAEKCRTKTLISIYILVVNKASAFVRKTFCVEEIKSRSAGWDDFGFKNKM